MNSFCKRMNCLISVSALMILLWSGLSFAETGGAQEVPAVAGQSSDSTQAASRVAQDAAPDEPRVRIGPGDLLEMSVFDVPELGQVVRVNDLGDASFNLIGRLHVAGLTTDQARVLIARKLRDANYVLDPQVSVLIREYNTQGVSVLGEVKRPGVYSVLGSQSLLDVIAAAGGTTPFAGPEVTVKRSADGTTLTVRLSKDAQASLDSDVQLHPGDKVVIPRAGLVYVIGDVGRPGGFIMENDGKLTLLQALAMAGGNNHTASLSHAKLIRKRGSGYADVPLPLKKIIEGAEPDVQLQTEDILYIPSSVVKSMFSRTVPSIVSSASAAAVYHSIP
jgi:polysaccharide export outer membrane protein